MNGPKDKILWTLLLLFSISQVASIQDASRFNYSLLQSINWMTKGIQLGTFDLVDSDSLPPPGVMHYPIMAFTYNPGTKSSQLPDQLEVIEEKKRIIHQDTARLITTSVDLADLVAISDTIAATVPAEVDTIRASLSAMFSNEFKYMREQESYMAISLTTISKFKLRFKDENNIKLEPEFLKACQKAALNESTFDQIITKYGTHYISSALFGGLVAKQMLFDSATFDHIATKNFFIAYGYAIDYVTMDDIADSSNWDDRTMEHQEVMADKAEHSCNVIGGRNIEDRICSDPEIFQSWKQSLEENSEMIFASLTPIYKLPALKAYSGPLREAVKRNLVTTAITELILRLRENRNQGNWLAAKLKRRSLSGKAINKLIGKMKKCLNGMQFSNLDKCIKYVRNGARLALATDLQPLYQFLSKQYRCGIGHGHPEVSRVSALLHQQLTFVNQSCTTAQPQKTFYLEAFELLTSAQEDFLRLYHSLKSYITHWSHYPRFDYTTHDIAMVLVDWQMVLKAASECNPAVYSNCTGWCKFICMFDIASARKECRKRKKSVERCV